MIADELVFNIKQCLGLVPTQEQDKALSVFARFLTVRDDRAMMLLRGSAGTGKTTLSGAIVRTLWRLHQKAVLLAPTGRAAKVFALNSGHAAYTIHRRIYRQKSMDGAFSLAPNMHTDTLFIVDEASMIANGGLRETVFGTGCLLDDLVSYVYGGRNCRLMLVGDTAQLPPVGEDVSPALCGDFMRGYGLQVYEADLNEVLRQSGGSGILYNAIAVRRMITHGEVTQLPKIRFKGFADIVMVPGDELIERLASSYSEVGTDETMVVTRSNKRANIYNQGIRNTVLWREEQFSTGDLLMVVKNNYYWTETDAAANATPGFIANGDRAVVQRVRNHRELYGFHFADMWLQFPDYDNYELNATVMTDTLTTEAPALTQEQNRRLYDEVMLDYADIPTKPERIKKLKHDPYYNAIQIKYAYAVTCHKAQGGQWAHVYVDQGYMTDEMLSPEYVHWLYTAFTRATEKLFLVNWPKAQTAV